MNILLRVLYPMDFVRHDLEYGREILVKNRFSKFYNIFLSCDYVFAWIVMNITELKLGQFDMPETCENWLGHANICVYLPVTAHSVDFKAAGHFIRL